MTPHDRATPGRIYYGWWVAGAFALIIFLSPGIRFTVGPFLKPVAAELGVDRGTFSLVVSLSLFLYGAFMPMVGRLVDRFGSRVVCSAGGGLVAVSLALPGTATAHSGDGGQRAVGGLHGGPVLPGSDHDVVHPHVRLARELRDPRRRVAAHHAAALALDPPRRSGRCRPAPRWRRPRAPRRGDGAGAGAGHGGCRAPGPGLLAACGWTVQLRLFHEPALGPRRAHAHRPRLPRHDRLVGHGLPRTDEHRGRHGAGGDLRPLGAQARAGRPVCPYSA